MGIGWESIHSQHSPSHSQHSPSSVSWGYTTWGALGPNHTGNDHIIMAMWYKKVLNIILPFYTTLPLYRRYIIIDLSMFLSSHSYILAAYPFIETKTTFVSQFTLSQRGG